MNKKTASVVERATREKHESSHRKKLEKSWN